MTSMQWHPIPGRLQSVSVASKSNIWGVTLDLQLCKLNPKTLQWQLVCVTSEPVNRPRFSSGSTNSALTTSPIGSSVAVKALSSIIPSLSMSSTPSPQRVSLSQSDQDSDSTFQVSAAEDGTVVRLDKTLKTWYLVGSQNRVDFENDVIWIDLGHLWKCVSVASVSQIWGLSDNGDIYYGTSDRFVKLEPPVTSGAGYNMPKFTQISVGQDNLVIATDAHSGTVFRLKTHPTSSHPPVWTALDGTGPGNAIHMVNCSLASVDYIVGLSKEGQVYRRCNGNWIPIGGSIKLNSIDVGVDGYVMGVDRDGDLYACQLQTTIAIPRRNKDDDPYRPNSPQAPNLPNLPSTPRLQGASKRPMVSSRELFEMESPDKAPPGPYRFALGDSAADSMINPGAFSSPVRYTFGRSDSQVSKKSYASELTPMSPLSGMNLARQLQRGDSISRKLANITPLRIQTGKNLSRESSSYRSPEGDSYFSSKLIANNEMSSSTSSPIGQKRNSTDSRRSSRLAYSESLTSEEDQNSFSVKSSSSSTSKNYEKGLDARENVDGKQELSSSSEALELSQLQHTPDTNELAVGAAIGGTAAAGVIMSASGKGIPRSLSIPHNQSQRFSDLPPAKTEWNGSTGDLTPREGMDNIARLPHQVGGSDQVMSNGYNRSRVSEQPGTEQGRMGWDAPYPNSNSSHPLAQPSAPSPGTPYSANQYPTSMPEPWQGIQRPPAPNQYQGPGGLTSAGPFPGRNGDLEQYQQQQQPLDSRMHDDAPGLLKRSSDASDVILEQQQEFLRLTRLRSDSSSKFDGVNSKDIEDGYYNDSSDLSRDNSFNQNANDSNNSSVYGNNPNGPYINNGSAPYGNNGNGPYRNNSNGPLNNGSGPYGNGPYGNSLSGPPFDNGRGPYINNLNGSPINNGSGLYGNNLSSPCINNSSGPYGNGPNSPHVNNGYGPYNNNPNSPCVNNGSGPYGNNLKGPHPNTGSGPYGNNPNALPVNNGNSPYGNNNLGPRSNDNNGPYIGNPIVPHGNNAAGPHVDSGNGLYGSNPSIPHINNGSGPYGNNPNSPYVNSTDGPHNNNGSGPHGNNGSSLQGNSGNIPYGNTNGGNSNNGNNSNGSPYNNNVKRNSNNPYDNANNNPFNNINNNGLHNTHNNNPYCSINSGPLPNGASNTNVSGPNSNSKMELLADDGQVQQENTGPYGRNPAISTSAAFNTEPAGINAGLVNRRPKVDEINETPGRPSYSSSHLQQYVDTTVSPQPAADTRKGTNQAAIGSTGAASAVAVAKTKPKSKGQGGIQGEDAQGRWVGGATTSNPPVTQFDPQVHKSKCCIIQ
ncbi:hypothetical protein BGX27_006243 [Mortierella sp. AM989]|nr:hypothetical protein BGX27_006243 [Mortierella sp. AM989]